MVLHCEPDAEAVLEGRDESRKVVPSTNFNPRTVLARWAGDELGILELSY